MSESTGQPAGGAEFSIDLNENSASLKIGPDIYLRILSKAMGQTQKDIADLETALPVGDFANVQAIAHRLKGDYDNMRITVLSNIAKEMNEISKTSQDKDLLTKRLGDFKKHFTQLQQFIKARTENG